MALTSFFHYGTVGLSVALSSLGVGIGEGLVSLAALKAITIQPNAKNELSKIFILGVALIETSAVVGLTVSFILLMPIAPDLPYLDLIHYSEIGILLAISLTGFVVGIASSFPAQAACLAVARQPFFSQKILSIMLLTQSLMQTPIIFAFIIILFIKGQMLSVTTMADTYRLIASGLCIGLASIGPTIGLALFSKAACNSVGINRNAYPEVLSFTLISEALIESPLIFALLISIMLTQIQFSGISEIASIASFLGAAFCMALGTLGSALASGRVAAQACSQIARNPQNYGVLSRTSIFAQVLIESCSIYTLVVSLALLFAQ